MKITFKKETYNIEPFQYLSGRRGLKLVKESFGNKPWFSITLDIDSVKINDGEIILKNWDRCEGIVEYFVLQKIIENQAIPRQIGLNKYYICKLTKKTRKKLKI